MMPSVIAAAVTGGVALIVAILTPAFNGAAERRLRKREPLASAVGALATYREYPYVVRRREAEDPPGERRRISAEVMRTQRELTEASIWIAAEAPDLAAAYDAAVVDHRRIAGSLMKDAWNAPAITSDGQMNVDELHEKLAPLHRHDETLARLIREEVRFRWNPFR